MSERIYQVKLLMSEFVTHDVKRFIVEKPHNYSFEPGQAVEMSIDHPQWQQEKRPFTFTSLNDDQVLEFIIKQYPSDQYPDHHGFTEKLHQLKPGAGLLIGEPWGTIHYEGPGVFIAGGAGITPFIAIFRMLRQRRHIEGQTLIFSNKTSQDVILEKEWRRMFDKEGRLILSLTREKDLEHYEFGRVNQQFLQDKINDFNQKFYVCGPPAMVRSIKQTLKELGAESQEIIFEE
jgi:cytochrome-b5 reductase